MPLSSSRAEKLVAHIQSISIGTTQHPVPLAPTTNISTTPPSAGSESVEKYMRVSVSLVGGTLKTWLPTWKVGEEDEKLLMLAGNSGDNNDDEKVVLNSHELILIPEQSITLDQVKQQNSVALDLSMTEISLACTQQDLLFLTQLPKHNLTEKATVVVWDKVSLSLFLSFSLSVCVSLCLSTTAVITLCSLGVLH